MSNAQLAEKVFRFTDLPPELIYKILTNYQYSSRRLRLNRLISRQFDEWVKHVALHSLDLSRKLLPELEDIASRPNAFDRVTKTLILPRVSLAVDDVKKALEATTRRIIRKMTAVQAVHWDLHHPSVASATFEAICQIPLLEKLVIYPPTLYTLWEDSYLLRDEKFMSKSLKSFSITCRAADASALTNYLHDLVAANAGLEELISWDEGGFLVHSFNFAAIVGDTPDRPGFRPSLMALHAGNLRLSPSPNILKYLSNLTSLTISNLYPEYDALWPAFHLSGITFKELSIERPTERLTDYLLGYLGLERLVVTRQQVDYRVPLGVSNDTKARFLEDGVAHHRNSLVRLEITFYPDHYQNSSHLDLWALDERQITWLEQFHRMTTLAVSFAHDGEETPTGTKLSIDDALTGLFTRLAPTLREVELLCGTSEDYGKISSDYGLIRCVRSFEFSTRPRNHAEMRLEILDSVWRISYDETRGKYYFVLAWTVGEEERD